MGKVYIRDEVHGNVYDIQNFNNYPQDKCVTNDEAILYDSNNSTATTVYKTMYPVASDTKEVYDPYRVVIFEDFIAEAVSQQFRVIIFINWDTNEDNNYQVAGLSYNANYNQGYFVPESFNISTDIMRDYIVDNDGFALYPCSGSIRTNMSIVTSSITQDTLFGLFYNGSNELFTTDNSFFPMFEEGTTINMATIETAVFENKDDFINNFKNIYISLKFLLNNSGNVEKAKIYDRYFNLRFTGELIFGPTVTLKDENTLTVTQRSSGVSQFGGFEYDYKCFEAPGPNGIKAKIFQCNIPLLIFR